MFLNYLILFSLLVSSQCFAKVNLQFDQPSDIHILENFANDQDGLHVFWWNIHHGQSNLKKPNHDFTQNLTNLIHSKSSPDVMSFAEYSDGDLQQDSKFLYLEVMRLYPYQKFVSYKDTPLSGVITMSKYPLVEKSVDELDFVPLREMSNEEKAQYREQWCGGTDTCTRYFQVLNIEVHGKVYTLVPVHLFDCWRHYSKLFGKVATAAQIIYGKSNPLFYQIERLKMYMKLKIGEQLKLPGVLLYGDFNIPDHVEYFPTLAYSIISKNLTNSLALSSQDRPSFPSNDSQEYQHYPSLQIDHALVSPGTEVGISSVISLKGSDHYPIYINLK